MASIEIINVSQPNPEAPIEIQLSNSNLVYRGPAGRDGIIGHDGKSAYEIAVDNGFIGTETEWLASLQGTQGVTPIKGVDYFTQQDIADVAAQVSGYREPVIITYDASSNLVSNRLLAFADKKDKLLEIINYGVGWQARYQLIIQQNEVLSICQGDNIYQYKFILTPNSKTEFGFGSETSILGVPVCYYSVLFNTNMTINSVYWLEQTIPSYNIDTSTAISRPGSGTTLNDTLAAIVSNYATKAYVEEAIRGAESGLLKRSVVQSLPISDIDEDTIYMLAKTGSNGDVYDEYLYVNNAWEKIGSTAVDLTNYATITYVDTGLANKQSTLTAGTGITLSGSTISINTEYLTNSDILAIWNGENE